MQKVISNNLNADDDSKQVEVYLNGSEILGENDTEVPTSSIPTGETFTVSFVYGTSGAKDAGLVTRIDLK